MPNGIHINDDLEFEALISTFTDAEKFLARHLRATEVQVSDIKLECSKRATCSTNTCPVDSAGIIIPQSIRFTKKQIVLGTGGGVGVVTIISILVQVFAKYFEIA